MSSIPSDSLTPSEKQSAELTLELTFVTLEALAEAVRSNATLLSHSDRRAYFLSALGACIVLTVKAEPGTTSMFISSSMSSVMSNNTPDGQAAVLRLNAIIASL